MVVVVVVSSGSSSRSSSTVAIIKTLSPVVNRVFHSPALAQNKTSHLLVL